MIQLTTELAPPPEIRTGRRGNGSPLLRELVGHLRKNRARLLADWSRRINAAPLPAEINKDNLLEKASLAYDDYVEALAGGRLETLQSYFARRLPADLIESGFEAHQVFALVDLLRGMLTSSALDRSLFAKFRHI